MGVIVVGYVPKPEGLAALRASAEEAESSIEKTPSSLSRSSRRSDRSSRLPGWRTRSVSSSAA
jgi:hypothetical protein